MTLCRQLPTGKVWRDWHWQVCKELGSVFTQGEGGWGVMQAINISVFFSFDLSLHFPGQPSGNASLGSYYPLSYLISTGVSWFGLGVAVGFPGNRLNLHVHVTPDFPTVLILPSFYTCFFWHKILLSIYHY